MNQGSYIFRQVMGFLPGDYFEWLVKKYDGNKYVKSFTCWNHLLVLILSELKLKMDTYDVLRILNVSLLTRLILADLLTEANRAEVLDERYVQLLLEFKE